MQKIERMVGLLPRGSTKYNLRPLHAIEQIVVHHSADNGTIQSIAEYHTAPKPKGNGWPGIGYTFVIDQEGIIYQAHDLDTLCFNVANQNTKSLGICLIGNFEKNPVPPAQLESLKWLIPQVKQFLKPLKVIGHREAEGAATKCPGKHLFSLIAGL